MFKRNMRQHSGRENHMEQAEDAAPTAVTPAPVEPQAKPPAVGKQRSAQEVLGVKSDLLGGRLAEQAATTQRLPVDDAKSYLERGASAVAALGELAPANAIEALLATQMVASHNASLDLLQRAMADSQPARAIEERTRQYARLSDVFLKQLDRFQRQRGRQRQTIRIEHVRVVEDGKVTVRQEEERVR
jgi:hypothetical protein